MGPRSCSSDLKSQFLLQDLTGQRFSQFPSERYLGLLILSFSLRISHRITVFQSQKETSTPHIFCPMPQIMERLFISGPICSIFFIYRVILKDKRTIRSRKKLSSYMIQPLLQKSVFSLYLLLIITLRKPSYYPSSPAQNEVLRVKKKNPPVIQDFGNK